MLTKRAGLRLRDFPGHRFAVTVVILTAVLHLRRVILVSPAGEREASSRSALKKASQRKR